MFTALGLVSGALTSLSFVPQVARTLRTASTADLSWAWLAMFAAGVGGWIGYGVVTADLAVIVTNVVMTSLVAVLIAVKLRHQAGRGTG